MSQSVTGWSSHSTRRQKTLRMIRAATGRKESGSMRASVIASHRSFPPPPHPATSSPGRQLSPFRRQWECSTKIVPWFRQASFWKGDPSLQTMTERVHTSTQALRTSSILRWKDCNNKLHTNGFSQILGNFLVCNCCQNFYCDDDAAADYYDYCDYY